MSSLNETQTKPSRRERQREETRRDLALIGLDLASERGLANVRVPEIAAAAGVSTRTFNNYFPSKEAAIAWPAMRRFTRIANTLLARPGDEPLRGALLATIRDLYAAPPDPDQPTSWVGKFRLLAATEPTLRAEYLRISDAGEQVVARAIAERIGAGENELRPKVLAAMVMGAERAAIRHWMNNTDGSAPLVDTVGAAVREALKEVEK
ncbi:MAG TPA: TetR family transcriptional regulator [Solirubrobacteraceae bacterium]|nr:TetR family transcriptional regulator [Solirubrobacteraceae bacterium]